jgi:hypothetical protein
VSQDRDLKEIEKRTYRESLQDGLMEILIGGLLYMCGLLVADPKVMPVFLALYVIYLTSLPRILEAAKRRYTYPRLGKVVLHQRKPRPVVTGVALHALGWAALVATVLAVSGRLTVHEWYRWLPVWLGLCLVGAFWSVYFKSGSARYLVYAVVALGAGIAIGCLRLPAAKDYVAVYLIGTGTLSALIGGITLARFVRKHPRAAEELPEEGARS